MNFLAHIYLSGENQELKFGNFIGDWVKGRDYNNYPEIIRNGIILHRKIDTFTDKHPFFLKSVYRLRQIYGKHAGIVVDILYDHYLASNWSKYSNVSLKKFSKQFYRIIIRYYKFLPPKGKNFIPYFICRDRLVCYADLSCFENVISLMSRYTSLPEKTNKAMTLIKNNYKEFETDFKLFFKDAIENFKP